MDRYLNKKQELSTPQEDILHCLDDFSELKRIGLSGATVTNTGIKLSFPKYQCPICNRNYTSLIGFADKEAIKLGKAHYINIDPKNDKQRYELYLKLPKPVPIGSRCYAFGVKNSFVKCRRCGTTHLVKTSFKRRGTRKKKAIYHTLYCKQCDIYYIDYSTYRKHRTEWVLLNKDEIPLLKEELRIENEEKEKRRIEQKAKREEASIRKREEKRQKKGGVEITHSENAEIDRLIKVFKERKKENQQSDSEDKDSILHRHDNNIRVKDFVVRRTTFKCRHASHKLENIEAVINIIDKNGDIKEMSVSAGYCPKCSIFFIMESTYQSLKMRGTPVCRVSDEKTYLSNHIVVNGMQLAQESILKQYGYSVSQEEGLTTAQRRRILALLVDNNVLTKSDIISYLDFFVSQRKYQHRYEKAIEKWESDREFIVNYRAGTYAQYGVSGIYRRH